MKYLFILTLGLFSLKACDTSPYIELNEAKQRDWVAGVEFGGRGTDYFIYTTITETGNYKFVNFFIDNKALEVYTSDTVDGGLIQVSEGDFVKGQKLVVISGESSKGLNNKAAFPIQSDAKALLSYSYKGKTHYLAIPEIEVLELNSMP